MEEHALIMRNEEGSKLASPEQMQIWMKQTMGWIGGIAAQNKFVSGTRLLFDDARVVNSNKVVTNGPFGEIKETIGGFIIVKAGSADEAAGFAKSCMLTKGDEVALRLPGEERIKFIDKYKTKLVEQYR